MNNQNRSSNISANLGATEILAIIPLAAVAKLCYRITKTNYIVRVHFLPHLNLESFVTRLRVTVYILYDKFSEMVQHSLHGVVA
ncbi:hypothetical protein CC80DRAFT_228995 [Byssothecium circinans]|uniref:Uncharacterized protein n=1 Tax=Byssothecium circinans TaxID=147558 RepID=A0A6A5TEL7_9PLEO|nr:hypothetical protein CC80DRAFT_228995 [Byssothecium circinans]